MMPGPCDSVRHLWGLRARLLERRMSRPSPDQKRQRDYADDDGYLAAERRIGDHTEHVNYEPQRDSPTWPSVTLARQVPEKHWCEKPPHDDHAESDEDVGVALEQRRARGGHGRDGKDEERKEERDPLPRHVRIVPELRVPSGSSGAGSLAI